MRPSIRLLPPVPESVVGGVMLVVLAPGPDAFVEVATAPWRVNLVPPTLLAVCVPLYVTLAWVDVPAIR